MKTISSTKISSPHIISSSVIKIFLEFIFLIIKKKISFIFNVADVKVDYIEIGLNSVSVCRVYRK
jgi:hypothetical protein